MPYVALITGASSGIGEATARRLAREPDTQLILVARREDRLLALADELGSERALAFGGDLTEPGAPEMLARAIEQQYGSLNLLVNNAGARWSQDFADGGWANVEQHMRINFEAPVRLVEALLPLMRRTAAAGGPLATGGAEPGQPASFATGGAEPGQPASFATGGAEPGQPASFAGRPLTAPVAIVNVTSTAARIARRGTGGYSAAKFALAGWTDSLRLEERRHGIHVGNVLPGFIATEGFPQAELRDSPLTSWAVSEPPIVAEAILDAGPGGRAERYVPRYYWAGALLRLVAPGLIWRGASSDAVATSTNSV